MLKKSIALCLLSLSFLASMAFCRDEQDFMFAATVPSQNDQQDKGMEVMQESQPQTPVAPVSTPVQLERSGVGRASVHLQILQQSNQHFADNSQTVAPAPANPAKKTAADDKKTQAKSASST